MRRATEHRHTDDDQDLEVLPIDAEPLHPARCGHTRARAVGAAVALASIVVAATIITTPGGRAASRTHRADATGASAPAGVRPPYDDPLVIRFGQADPPMPNLDDVAVWLRFVCSFAPGSFGIAATASRLCAE